MVDPGFRLEVDPVAAVVQQPLQFVIVLDRGPHPVAKVGQNGGLGLLREAGGAGGPMTGVFEQGDGVEGKFRTAGAESDLGELEGVGGIERGAAAELAEEDEGPLIAALGGVPGGEPAGEESAGERVSPAPWAHFNMNLAKSARAGATNQRRSDIHDAPLRAAQTRCLKIVRWRGW